MEINISPHNPIAKYHSEYKKEDNAIIEKFHELFILKQFEAKSKPFIRIDLLKALDAFEIIRSSNSRLISDDSNNYSDLCKNYINKLHENDESRWEDVYAYLAIIELLKDYGFLDKSELETINNTISYLLQDIKNQWDQIKLNNSISVDTMEFFYKDIIKLQDRDVASLRLLYAYICDEDITKVFHEIYKSCDETALEIAIEMQRFFVIDNLKIFKLLSEFPGIESYMPPNLKMKLSEEINNFVELIYNDSFNEFITLYAIALEIIDSDIKYRDKLINLGLTSNSEFDEIKFKVRGGDFNGSQTNVKR